MQWSNTISVYEINSATNTLNTRFERASPVRRPCQNTKTAYTQPEASLRSCESGLGSTL